MKNRAEKSGRKAITVSLSFTERDVEHAQNRVEEFRPILAGPSNYVRLLIEYDRKHNIIGKILPKLNPELQLAGFAE